MTSPVSWKSILYSAFNTGVGLFIYWHLYTGGWLTNPYYRLNDPDIANLLVAILEPLIVLAVVIFWLKRTPKTYRILFCAFILQCLIAAGFLAFIIVFMFTWKPRLM